MVSYNANIDRTVALYNHISGPIYLLISLVVFAIVWRDKDKRNTVYKRLMLGMQFYSFVTTLVLSSCAVVILTNEWALHAVGFTLGLSIVPIMMVVLYCLFQLLLFWVASLLYCHQQVLPLASIFRLRPNLQKITIIGLEISYVVYLSLFANTFVKMHLSDDDIPEDIQWIKFRQCFGVFRYHHESILILLILVAITGPPFVALIVMMFIQIFYYLRSGMKHSSEGTRRAQRRVAVTVLLLAIIPGCSLGIPCIGGYLLLLKRIPLLENVLSFVTVFESPEVSAILFALANTHSIANSLTIVGRSPRYRAVLLTPIAKYLGKTARRDRATTVRVGAFTPP